MKDQVILSWPMFFLILGLGLGLGWMLRCEYNASRGEFRALSHD